MTSTDIAHRALIIGCTSGLGLELTYRMIEKGYVVGGTGGNEEVLRELESQFGNQFHWDLFDPHNINSIKPSLTYLIKKMHGMDICIISAALSGKNNDLQWAIDEKTIRTNIVGFTAVANFAAHYFIEQNHGHIVGISSLTKYLGSPTRTVFNASKAYISIYLAGLRQRLKENNIYVTEICPGFEKRKALDGFKNLLWLIPIKRAAKQTLKAIEHKKKVAYLTTRWRLLSWFLRKKS